MDPVAALQAAQRNLDNGSAVDALERVLAYYHWRVKNGSAPVGCDYKAEILSAQILDKLGH